MKSLTIGAAFAALAAAPAAAQDATMSEAELRALLADAELAGYRVLDDSCLIACDAATGDTDAVLRSVAQHAAASSGSGDAPTEVRTDEDADAVAYRGNGRGLQRFRTAPQVVYLKFDNDGSAQFPVDVFDFETRQLLGRIFVDDYVYSQSDRAFIADRVRADYAPFDVEVVITEPASGEYATIDFTDNDRPLGQSNFDIFLRDDGLAFITGLFGRADEIDFGNDNYGGGAFADPNYYNAVYEIFSPGFYTVLSGRPGTPEGLREGILNTAAQIGGHEIGHSLGLRHHDSFGAPDNGIPPFGPPRDEFVPFYDGPAEADETVLHLMATPAFGLPLNEFISTTDGFFSERSALKLHLAERARVFLEGALRHDRRSGTRVVDLKTEMVPNTIVEGQNAGGNKIKMDVAWVQGRIGEKTEADEYRFTAGAGEFINAELISFSDFLIEDDLIAKLRLFRVGRGGERTLVAENLQTFEPYDPFLLDVQVPEYGEYVLEVTPQEVAFVPIGSGEYFPVPLDTDANRSLLTGNYDLLIYQVDKALGARPRRDEYVYDFPGRGRGR